MATFEYKQNMRIYYTYKGTKKVGEKVFPVAKTLTAITITENVYWNSSKMYIRITLLLVFMIHYLSYV